ncbi:hypothetical protein ACLOJK_005680 [Asimina triloba]
MAQNHSFRFLKSNPRPPLSCALPFLLFLSLAAYYSFLHHHRRLSPNASFFHSIFLQSSNNATLASFLHSLTRHSHLAGTPPAIDTFRYVQSHFQAAGLSTHVAEYQALLSYPTRASLSLRFPNGTSADLFLQELGQSGRVVAPYHAYSPSASVVAPAVFVNYGREKDYRELRAMGVDVGGCVAVVRRGSLPRAGVVERAEKEGAAAVLLYADADGEGGGFDGGIERGTVMRGLGDPLTPGWAGVDGGERLPLDDGEVQRKFPRIPSLPISTENARIILGSLGGPPAPEEWTETFLEKRPRVGVGPTVLNFTQKRCTGPVWDAQCIGWIGRVGNQGSMVRRCVELARERSRWRILLDYAFAFHGSAFAHPKLRQRTGEWLLDTGQDVPVAGIVGVMNVYRVSLLWRRDGCAFLVIALARKEEPQRYILLGNHRDAWTYGAVDPNSGTAALLDIVRRYGNLLDLGWRPRRTIIFCSWDAEEFGMIGSTEWVEQNLVNLASKAVVYLNVDCAVQGPGFFARATPQLDNLLVDITKKIKDPDSEGMTVYQAWVAANRNIHVGRLNDVDSDFAAFLQHAGIASIDFYYGKDCGSSIRRATWYIVLEPSAMCPALALESYLMNNVELPGAGCFQEHIVVSSLRPISDGLGRSFSHDVESMVECDVAEIWGLLALRLADDLILPFNYLSYAIQLQEHMKEFTDFVGSHISLHPINASIVELIAASKAVQEVKKLAEGDITENSLNLLRQELNDRLMLAERGFLDVEGIKGRQWFKHLVYGPPKDYESELKFYPGIADAISRSQDMGKMGGQSDIQHEIWRVARAIRRVAMVLKGELT